MKIVSNPHRGGQKLVEAAPYPSTNAARVANLLKKCPAAAETPLVSVDGLADVGALWVKDERDRMNLGSFKALGAAYVIARHAVDRSESPDDTTLSGFTYVTVDVEGFRSGSLNEQLDEAN